MLFNIASLVYSKILFISKIGNTKSFIIFEIKKNQIFEFIADNYIKLILSVKPKKSKVKTLCTLIIIILLFSSIISILSLISDINILTLSAKNASIILSDKKRQLHFYQILSFLYKLNLFCLILYSGLLLNFHLKMNLAHYFEKN